MAFLDKLDGFYGTGERDSAGRTLEEFLEVYDARKYDTPANTTDIVVVRCRERLEHWGQPLQVLLVKRSNHPSIGFWATPGGFVEMRESLYEGAARELEEETGVKDLPLMQLSTWGDYDRDPRWRVITTVFVALVEGDITVQAGDDAADAVWMDAELTRESAEADGPDAALEGMPGSREVWNLQLTNGEKQVHLHAKVEITHSAHRLLSQESYRLLECDGIAVDHGCIITQALLYLRKQLVSEYK